MCPPEALKRVVGPPSGLNQIVNAALLVLGPIAGVEAKSGAAGIGENQNPAFAILEIFGLGPRLCLAALLDLGFGLAVLAGCHHALRPASHFSHTIRPEPVDDLVQRAFRHVDQCDLIHQTLFFGQGGRRLHHLAVTVQNLLPDCPLRVIRVLHFLVKLGRETLVQEIQKNLPRRQIQILHRDFVAFGLGAGLGQSALLDGLSGIDQLQDRAVARGKLLIHVGQQGR